MGEKPAGRMLVLVGLLFASLFIGMASAEPGELTLEVSEDTPPETAWYSPQHPLILTPTLVNNGPDASLTVNPVCPFVYNVYDISGAQVVNGMDACPVREQGMDVFAGERVSFDPVAWSMKDTEGQWLESSQYTVELYHSSGLTFTQDVVVQTPVAVPDGLAFSVITTERPDAEGPRAHLVSLYNPTSSTVNLSTTPTCFFEIQRGQHHLLGSSCFNSGATLIPGESILVEQVLAFPDEAVTISTPGEEFTYTSSEETSTTSSPSPSIAMSVEVSGNTDSIFEQGDQLRSEVLLVSTDVDPVVVEFTTSCKAEMWVLDDVGNIVFDSRDSKTCTAIELELALSEEPARLSLPQWNFYLDDGCAAPSGTYIVVAEVPEHGLVTSQSIHYLSQNIGTCAEAITASIDASLTWLDDSTINLSVGLSGETSEYVRLTEPCTFEAIFFDAEGDIAHALPMFCTFNQGRKILVPPSPDGLVFDSPVIDLVQDGTAIIPEGVYTVQVNILATGKSTTSLPFSWPQDHQDDATTTADAPLVNEEFELLGTWAEISTEQGTCYVMDDGEATHLLSNAKTLPDWSPSAQTQGLYVVVLADPSPACAGFIAPSVEVVEVRMEEALAAEEEPVVAAPIAEETPLVQSSPAVAVVSVVVTASILSLFIVAATTNEALRLPATVAGLWFLGLLGKTHETTDGRYQRGRLMGYLTANPGCHFRALMSALEMSNGQITHHLRILEAEEHVWRKNDGRLVRFYPLTNQLNPSTKEADLPVPPLSPDPNSLQGKILNLLDEDGGMGQFPTQAELAKRLEKSQQLISHHLRTLQKFGLVERRKMGVKNRYKLTREAIFLLETSADFAHDDAR